MNMKNILAAAIGTGAQAIHPGFGFLSENSRFVEMCESCGITFIGPKSETISLMGNKANARIQMQQSGVPVIPGSEGFIDNVEEARKIAEKVGYPVLLKAAAGGGGKGIRRVNNEEELTNAYEEARREALSAFGDSRMYLEKIMENVKHIEVQVFRDEFGHSVYFPERDCSIQRNKQKMIEESPCSLVTPEQRKQLGEIAVRAVDAIDYRNTGTIEFLMDKNHRFYFMEMNTRIQVEHTVTEMVTGVDLVKAQVRVASGEPLPFRQEDIKLLGSAIECRINAEDPFTFTPCPGKITAWHLPGGPGIRIDTHVFAGYTVPPYYDSMIGKLIAYGDTREQAIARMRIALSEFACEGIKTNVKLHRLLLADERFASGGPSIHYLEEKLRKRKDGGVA